MMNKIGVTALALVMVLACSLALVSAPTDAVDRDMQMSLATVSAQPGATSVAVDLTIDKNVGFYGAQITIEYDSSLTLTDVKDGKIMTVVANPTYSSPYSVYIQSYGLEDTTATGTVLTLVFNVSSSAPDEMPVAFSSVSMYNYDEDEIDPYLTDGKVVTGEVTIPVTGVALDKTAVTIDVGESVTLNYVIAPTNATNKNVTWSSTDESVITVSNGVVRAVGYGTANVIVTTEDGGRTGSCIVTVAAPTTPVTGVELNKSTMTLSVGSSDSLIATVLPSDASNKAVNWSSSNKKVATVVDGTVTALSEGDAVIIVTTVDGGYAAMCTLKVEKAPDVPVAVTGISLNKTSMALNSGSSETLTATILPTNATNKGINWASSNPAAATVTNGVVTGVADGTAVITATTVDGGKMANCVVTVTTTAVPVTGINLSKCSISVDVGKSTTLTASVQPSNATNKNVTWKSSDESVATVVNGVVKGVSAGSAIITATAVDGGSSASCSVSVTESGSGSGDSGGDNTMLYLGIVIAIIIALLIIALFLKKSGKI